MELINKEIDGDYMYCAERDAYVKVSKKGKELGVLPAEYVPDPVATWKSKALTAGYTQEDGTVNFEDALVKTLRPTETVWKIWEHKNADTNA